MTPHPPLARSPFSHRRRLFISSTLSCIGFVPSSLMVLHDKVLSHFSIFSGVRFSAYAKKLSSCSYISPPGRTLSPNLSIALCLILFIRISLYIARNWSFLAHTYFLTPHPPLTRSPFSHRRRLFISSTLSALFFSFAYLCTLREIGHYYHNNWYFLGEVSIYNIFQI